jgi:BolA protein
MTLSRSARIEQALQAQFAPSRLEVVDESHRHAGGPSAESHYNVILVADAMCGLRPLARHRAVHAALEAELKGGMHALTLKLLSPDEVDPDAPLANPSPACHGGG